MTIKDIIFLKSVTPITIEEKPSKKSIEFAAKFITHFIASAFVENTRKQFQIPVNGLDIKKFIGTNLLDPVIGEYNIIYNSLQIVASSLKASLSLDGSVVDQMILLIYFNACIDLRYFTGFITQPVQFVVGRKNIASEIVDYPKEVGAILVPFATSQKTLIRWIKENWDSIGKQMDNHLTTNPFIIKAHKNTELVTEIFDLKDTQKKSFSDVALFLTDKYPDDPNVSSEEWVKRMYYYYKKIWNILPIPPKLP